MSDDLEAQARGLHDRLHLGVGGADRIAMIKLTLRAAVKAERVRIAERLDACFEPTAPATPIVSELVATALAIIQEGDEANER